MLAFGKQAPASITSPALVFAAPHVGSDAHIAYYEFVPAFISPELDRLYRHIHCSVPYFSFRKRSATAHTYIATRAGRIAAIFVHTVEGSTVRVLNEKIAIDARDIAQFASFIFTHFHEVSRIRFSLIGKQIGKLPFPSHQYGGAQDIVVALPTSADAYLTSLSNKSRRQIGQRMDKLARDYPGLEFRHYHDGDIDPRHVHALVDLKRVNAPEKHTTSGPGADEAAWIAQQACGGGLLTLAMLDGRLCGGSLSLRIADVYFPTLAAYEGRFDRHALGMLCCYMTVRENIACGARKIHLPCGRKDYRFKLRGVRRDLANLDIYRSSLACLWAKLPQAIDYPRIDASPERR